MSNVIYLAAFFDPHVFTNAIVVMMVPMFSTHVMAVDPMMTVLRPMAGHPNHFVLALPVTRTVAVVRPVTDFDADPCRFYSGPESEARRDREEQY